MFVILLTVLSDRLIRSGLDIVWNRFDLRISCPRWTLQLYLEGVAADDPLGMKIQLEDFSS